jgi:hypothetical protein
MNFYILFIFWLIIFIHTIEVFNYNIINYNKLKNILIKIFLIAGKGLKNNAFHKAALVAIEIWQGLGHTRKESEELMAQLRRFESRITPFELPYTPNLESPKLWWGSIKTQPRHLAELACRIFSINPTQANCERNFSTLNWILGENRTNLSLNRLEAIAKIRSYYMNNIQKELSYIGKNLTESELRESVNIASIDSIFNLENTNEIANNSDNYLPPESYSRTELAIGDIVDLTININDNSGDRNSDTAPAQVQQLNSADLNYNPSEVLNEFLEHERENDE